MSTVTVDSNTQLITVEPIPQVITVDAITQQIISVTTPTNTVSIINAGPQGPRGFDGLVGPAGPAGSGGSGTINAGYNHTQASASTLWIINHNLGYKPSVQMFNTGGLEVLGEIQHVSDNQTTVTFNTIVAGIARLT